MTAIKMKTPPPEDVGTELPDLKARLADALADAPRARAGDRVRTVLKAGLDEARRTLRTRFESRAAFGEETARSHARLMDLVIAALYDVTVETLYPLANPTKGEQLCVVATGGYGRGSLAPFSDIDLMFLLPYKQTPRGEQVVEFMLYTLWDMGLRVGHAVRTIDEAMRIATDDMSVRTSLLEARPLGGDGALFRTFWRRFDRRLMAGTGPAFVEAKLTERDARHQRTGNSRYVLEPNVKEGKGGLRDLQTLFWIAKYLYRVRAVDDLVRRKVFTPEDARRFAKAENFLWTVRCHLHLLAGRAEERLSFDIQTAIGERMGYTPHTGTRGVERFMKHYFLVAKDVGELTRILCAVLEEQQKKRTSRFAFRWPLGADDNVDGFPVESGRLSVDGPEVFRQDPVNLLRLFHTAQERDLDIHPRALRQVRQNLKLIDRNLRHDPEANRLFLDMLTSPKGPRITLTRLNEAGVFGRFVREFGRVVAQMQYDMYHVYTVDEHTIRAIDIVHRIETGELAADHPVSAHVIHELQSRRVLYVGVLLHDIAKGRGGKHADTGSRIARKLGPRLGLSEWETETVSWLVRHHLVLPEVAFKRDLEEPKTIADLVEFVQSPERLRLLLVLTVADIRAVGPGVWNGWKATLLREVYYRAMEAMTGGLPDARREARVSQAKNALRESLADWPADAIEAHLALGTDAYWLSFDAEAHRHHAGIARQAESRGLDRHIETRVLEDRDITEIVVYTRDHPGLFARIAGAMALSEASIVDAKITTLTNGMALDTFFVQDSAGGAFADPHRLKRLWRRIESALAERLDVPQELLRMRARLGRFRARVFRVPSRAIVDNRASANHTVIEVNGRDRPGFLYDVTSALTALGLQIASAHVSTYGAQAVDVFYVKDLFGLKVVREDRLERIRQALLEAITPPEARAETPAAAE